MDIGLARISGIVAVDKVPWILRVPLADLADDRTHVIGKAAQEVVVQTSGDSLTIHESDIESRFLQHVGGRGSRLDIRGARSRDGAVHASLELGLSHDERERASMEDAHILRVDGIEERLRFGVLEVDEASMNGEDIRDDLLNRRSARYRHDVSARRAVSSCREVKRASIRAVGDVGQKVVVRTGLDVLIENLLGKNCRRRRQSSGDRPGRARLIILDVARQHRPTPNVSIDESAPEDGPTVNAALCAAVLAAMEAADA